MPAFLVTGNPGSGKSELARELTRRGVLAIDPDDDPGLAHWKDAAGHQVNGPALPDGQWLRSHRWVWSRSRMEAVLAGHDRAVFVCGIARNQDELWDLFDRVFLLRIDGPTQESRLAAYDAQHPPGRGEAVRKEIREGRTVFETQMLRAGALPMDTSRSAAPEIFSRRRHPAGGTRIWESQPRWPWPASGISPRRGRGPDPVRMAG